MSVIRRTVGNAHLWLPLLAMALALWALAPGGMPNTADGPVHLIRSSEMVRAWQEGILLPRWSQNLAFGYGIPLFVYAPPLPYLLTALLHTVGLPLELALKGTMVIALLLGGSGAYRLVRAPFGAWPGVVAVAAFVYAPIQLRELFIQGNVAQYLAWAFAPWACWAAIQLHRSGRAWHVLVLALALAGAVLSHSAAALLLSGMLALLMVVLFVTTGNRRAAAQMAGGILLSLALSAWYWLPALLEGRYVQLDKVVASDFRSRFIGLAELIALSPRLDTGAINPTFPLTLGAVQVFLGLFGAGAVVWMLATGGRRSASTCTAFDRTTRGEGIFFVLFTALGAFMALAWSEPLWRLLPFAELFEFPFRWHGFTNLGLAWLSGAGVYVVSCGSRPRMATVGCGAVLLLIGSALVNLYPHLWPVGTFDATPADVVRFELHTSAVGTTSLGEFTPMWATQSIDGSPLVDDYRAGRPINRLPAVLPAGASGELLESSTHRQRYALSLMEPATLTLSLLYFPGWQATVDGVPAPLWPQPESGLMELAMPAGDHELALRFGATPMRRWAGALSALAWLGLAGWLVVALTRPRRPVAPAPAGVDMAPGAPSSVMALAAVILLLLGVRVGLSSWFRLESPPDAALPARQVLRVDFEDRLRLLGVDPAPDTAVAGDTLRLVAYWRALQRLDENYAVFLHLDDPLGRTVATTDQMHPADIPTSTWATGLYVRNPLALAIPADAAPMRYRLRAGLYDRKSGGLLSTTDGGDAAEVGQVWVSPAAPVRPPQGPQAQFGDEVQLLGVRYQPEAQEITLYWRTDAPVTAEATIFVHLFDADGTLIGQADGLPFDNAYATTDWRPGQIIEDRRSLAGIGQNGTTPQRAAVGLYDPATGVRWPAVDAQEHPLPDNALVLDLSAGAE